MKKLSSNFFTYLILFIIFIGVILYTFVGTYSNDDFWAGFFYSKNIFINILNADQGLVWSWITEKIVIHLIPNCLNLHPQQNIFLPIMKSFNFTLFIVLLSLFFNIDKKKTPNPLVIIINTFLIFSTIFLYDYLLLIQANQHFKYIFNLLIGTSILYIWIKEFLENKFLSFENLIRDCVFVVILVFAGHIINIPSFIIFFTFFIYLICKSKQNLKDLKNILILCFPIFILYCLCTLIYLNLPGFLYTKLQRMPSEPMFQYIISNLGNFSRDFCIHIIKYKYIAIIVAITLFGFIGMIINRKRIEPKFFVITISILIANIAFQFLLIVCGKTFYDHNLYWFESPDITSTFLFYLILDCNIIYGCLYKCIEKKKLKIAITTFLFIVINIIYPLKDIYNKAKDYYEKQLIQREAIYKLNKICRYYSLTSDIIYTPAEYVDKVNILAWQSVCEKINMNMTLIYHWDKNFSFEMIYNNITNEDKLFSKEELEHINFKKLYDDNFILKMEAPKYDW